jgi:hypothetical protein
MNMDEYLVKSIKEIESNVEFHERHLNENKLLLSVLKRQQKQQNE